MRRSLKVFRLEYYEPAFSGPQYRKEEFATTSKADAERTARNRARQYGWRFLEVTEVGKP